MNLLGLITNWRSSNAKTPYTNSAENFFEDFFFLNDCDLQFGSQTLGATDDLV